MLKIWVIYIFTACGRYLFQTNCIMPGSTLVSQARLDLGESGLLFMAYCFDLYGLCIYLIITYIIKAYMFLIFHYIMISYYTREYSSECSKINVSNLQIGFDQVTWLILGIKCLRSFSNGLHNMYILNIL